MWSSERKATRWPVDPWRGGRESVAPFLFGDDAMEPNNPPKDPASPRKITDLNVSCFVMARGYRLIKFEPGSRGVFTFDVPESVILDFFQEGNDLISARRLLDAMRNLKGLLHSHSAGGR